MDLGVNKSVKEFMRSKFREWYSDQVQDQLNEESEITPVDLKMSTMKPLSACWPVSLYGYISGNHSIVVNGYKAAGLNVIVQSGHEFYSQVFNTVFLIHARIHIN